MTTGIYKITNLINNKIYIGQSIHIEKRWKEHKYYSSQEKTAIQAAFKKYGLSNFSFEVIEECSKEKLDEREIYWIKFYNSYYNGYNMTKGGASKIKLDYEQIVLTYQKLGSIHATHRELNINRASVRKALEYYDIDYDKTRSTPQAVVMIDISTQQVLKEFNTIKEAASYVGISDAAIRKYFAGKLKSAGGYHWKKLLNNKER